MYSIKKQLEELKKKCCCKSFGTTVGEPTTPPVNGITTLIDLSTGIIYYYDSDTSTWEVAAGDTHMGNTDLVFSGSRIYDGDGKSVTYNDIAHWILNTTDATGIKLVNADGAGNGASVELTPGRVDILATLLGVTVGQLSLSNLGGTWGDPNGVYYLGDGFLTLPPTVSDVTPDYNIGINSVDGRLYRTTKSVIPSDLNNLKKDQIGITIDGGGAAITTGYKGRFRVPYSGTITGWTLIEATEVPVTTTSVVDVKLGTYANYDTTPTFASIAGSEKPTITTSEKGQDLSLSTWTTSVTAGDLIEYTVDSNDNAKKLMLFIDITKS